MREHRVAGRSELRLDAQDKARGIYPYGIDFALPGMLTGFILRSPHAHARILAIDTRSAQSLPGVRAVITGQDLDFLMPGVVCDQPLLARDRVRFAGEPVALVAATERRVAEAAARLIQVTYEPLPLVGSAEQAMQPDAPLLHPDWKSYQAEDGLVREGNVCCHSSLTRGNLEQGLQDADVIVESSYSTESVHQAHVEPRAAVATVNPDGACTVYSNTQLPFWIRTNVAHVLGVPEEEVQVFPLGIGGGFGSKLYPQLEPAVALLARKTGAPVRIVSSIEDELAAGLPRHPSRIYLKTGVKRDGTLVAHQARIVLDTGAYAGSGPEIASVCLLVLPGPYRIPHVRVDAYAVHTNKTNFGAYRGPGGPQSIFALESQMDQIAETLSMDALEFRLHNAVQDGDELANGQVVRGVGLRECLEKAAAAIEWDKRSGPHRGKGLACSWWTTTGGKSGARIRIDPDGSLSVTVGTQEIGTGAIMAGVPQVVAETMGVPLDHVRMIVADTAHGPWDFGSQGSRTLFNVGRAAQFACADLAQKLKDLAEKVLEVPAAGLELRDGAVVARDAPEQRVLWTDLIKLDSEGLLEGRGESDPEPATYIKSRLVSSFYPAFHYPSFHCHAAEVEVDPDTGQVTVLRYVAAHDIGFAVNPVFAGGQMHGGAVQGIGMALMEEIRYMDGQVQNRNWTDYKLPTYADAPDIEDIIVEHPVPGGPFGVKGLGESPVIEPPGALANAIRRAVGVRLYSLPMTAEKILFAMEQKEAP